MRYSEGSGMHRNSMMTGKVESPIMTWTAQLNIYITDIHFLVILLVYVE